MYCICFSASLFTVNVRGISSPFNGGGLRWGSSTQRFNDEPLFNAGDSPVDVWHRWDSDVGLPVFAPSIRKAGRYYLPAATYRECTEGLLSCPASSRSSASGPALRTETGLQFEYVLSWNYIATLEALHIQLAQELILKEVSTTFCARFWVPHRIFLTVCCLPLR